jgi:RNA polymerase sigma factor (sigma-70 family)
MNDALLVQLRDLLVARYDEIKWKLGRRLGNEELAGEVLQETYLHLGRPARIGTVRSPLHYILMIATNIARMRFRREKGWVSLDDVDQAVGLVDTAPDPAHSAEARSELAALQRAFDELTPRRRQILFAARVDGLRTGDIAVQLGISQRLVEMELKHALDHCALRLDRERVVRFGSAEQDASKIQEAQKAQGMPDWARRDKSAGDEHG